MNFINNAKLTLKNMTRLLISKELHALKSSDIAILQSFKQPENHHQLRHSSDKCLPEKPLCGGNRFKKKPCKEKPKKPESATPKSAAKAKSELKLNPPPLPAEQRQIFIKQPEECCGNTCPDALPRFDLLYYRRSDKSAQKYAQTWAECPDPVIKPKILCCFDKIKWPKMEKRTKKDRPQTACKQICVGNPKCPNMSMPGCRVARKPPKCIITTAPKNCHKRPPPYPSFSECSSRKGKPWHPMECKCLGVPTMCEVWAYHHKMNAIKKLGKC